MSLPDERNNLPAGAPVVPRGVVWLLTGSIAVLSLLLGGALPGDRTWSYLLLLAAGYLVVRDGPPTGVRASGAGWVRWLWLLPLAVAFPALWSVNRSLSYDAVLLWCAFTGTFWLAYVVARRWFAQLSLLLIIALFLPGAVTLVRFMAGGPLAIELTFEYRNAAGITMAALLLLVVSRQLTLWQDVAARKQARNSWPLLVGLAASFFIWHAASKGSLYSACIGLLCLVALQPRARRWPALLLGFGLLGVGLLVGNLPPTPTASPGVVAPASPGLVAPASQWLAPVVQAGSDYSTAGRLQLWAAGWRAFLARPWGWGPGTFGEVYLPYAAPGTHIYSRSAHSLLVGGLQETGILLPLVLGGLVFAWGRSVLRGWRRLSASEQTGLAGAVAGTLALAAHFMADLTWEIPSVLLTAAVLAGMVLGRLEEPATELPPAPSSPARSVLIPVASLLVALLLVLRPYYVRSLVDEGRAGVEANQPALAIPLLSRAVLLDPWNATAHAWLAQAHFQVYATTHSQAELPLADQAIHRALAWAPRSPMIYQQAAGLRLAAGDVPGYMALLRQGLVYAPQDPALRVQVAQAERSLGQVDQARGRLESLTQEYDDLRFMYSPRILDQWWPTARLTLADLYLKEGKVAAARAQATALLQEMPGQPGAQALLDQVPAP